MAKLLCTCGEQINDSSDFIRNKGHIIANQDYYDFFDEIQNKEWNELSTKAVKYFNQVFQCKKCNNLIVIKNTGRFDFCPLDKTGSSNVLTSYLEEKWLGTISATFKIGQGEIYWNSNFENGFRQNLTLDELKKIYYQKVEELTELNILRHSFLSIDGAIEHAFEYNK